MPVMRGLWHVVRHSRKMVGCVGFPSPQEQKRASLEFVPCYFVPVMVVNVGRCIGMEKYCFVKV